MSISIIRENRYGIPLGYYYGEDMLGPFCAECIKAQGDDPWDNPDFHPLFNDSEADTPTHCAECDAVMVHDLTEYGEDYVREAVAASDECPTLRPLLDAWRDAYSYLFDTDEV